VYVFMRLWIVLFESVVVGHLKIKIERSIKHVKLRIPYSKIILESGVTKALCTSLSSQTSYYNSINVFVCSLFNDATSITRLHVCRGCRPRSSHF
jgi:hypothetical protein